MRGGVACARWHLPKERVHLFVLGPPPWSGQDEVIRDLDLEGAPLEITQRESGQDLPLQNLKRQVFQTDSTTEQTKNK